MKLYALNTLWFFIQITELYTCMALQKKKIHPAQFGVGLLTPLKELSKYVHRKVTDAIPPGLVPSSNIWNHINEAPRMH